MREILTISIKPALRSRLNTVAKKYKLSKSDIVNAALEKYLAVKDFQQVREKLIPYAVKSGYLTDDDIFNDRNLK